MVGDVDYQRAWIKLTAVINSKRSHGQEALLADMSRIQAECAEEVPDAGASANEGPLDDEVAEGPSQPMSRSANPLDAQGGTNGNRSNREHVTV